jgi:micrococcal nuclease
MTRFGLLCVCLLSLSGCTPSGVSSSPPVAQPEPAFRVIDGDTFKVGDETVRIENIDAPESGDRAKCWAEAALARQSKDALSGLLNWGDEIEIARSERDRYGRTLARVSRNGEDLGEELVDRGLAARWDGKRWDWCAPMPAHAISGAPVRPVSDRLTAQLNGQPLDLPSDRRDYGPPSQ